MDIVLAVRNALESAGVDAALKIIAGLEKNDLAAIVKGFNPSTPEGHKIVAAAKARIDLLEQMHKKDAEAESAVLAAENAEREAKDAESHAANLAAAAKLDPALAEDARAAAEHASILRSQANDLARTALKLIGEANKLRQQAGYPDRSYEDIAVGPKRSSGLRI